MRTQLMICILTVGAGSAFGLALRHDVEESAYVSLAKDLDAVCFVDKFASGTLIAPDWVLTAAHAIEGIKRMRSKATLGVEIAGKTYTVKRVVFPEERAKEPTRHDIALLELTAPVPGVEPIPVHEGDPEKGAKFVLAGYGILASGDVGAELSPKSMFAPTRARRAGMNLIERIDTEDGRFFARFDGPDKALDLEAGPCIGDSGGPALVRVEGDDESEAKWQVVGIISMIDDADEDRVVGEYGEEFGMTIVAMYADWIRETITPSEPK